MATQSLVPQVTGVTEWAINADEPVLFDYNDTVRDPGEAAFERESTSLELYLPDPRRSSDHNPLVVGLDLDGTPNTLVVDSAVIINPGGRGGQLVLSATVAGQTFSQCPEVVLAVEGVETVRVRTSAVGRSSRCLANVQGGVVTFDRATGALRVVGSLPPQFGLTDDLVRFDLTLDGEVFSAEVAGRRQGPVWRY